MPAPKHNQNAKKLSKQDETVMIRVNPLLKLKWQETAKKLGLSLSAYIKKMVS